MRVNRRVGERVAFEPTTQTSAGSVIIVIHLKKGRYQSSESFVGHKVGVNHEVGALGLRGTPVLFPLGPSSQAGLVEGDEHTGWGAIQ